MAEKKEKEKRGETFPKKRKERRYPRVAAVSRGNRHSAVFFFVTAIITLVIVELVRFVVQLRPIEGQAYYRISVQWELLPQGIALVGSAFLLFDTYRRMGLLFLATQTGKVLTVFLCFVFLLAVYILAFTEPGHWVLVTGSSLLLVSAKSYHTRSSLKSRLRKLHLDKMPSSVWILAGLNNWLARLFLYGVIIFGIGLVAYPAITRAVESSFVVVSGVRITPTILDSFTLLVFFVLAGGSYYRSPFRGTTPTFAKKPMNQLKRNLELMYGHLEDKGKLDIE